MSAKARESVLGQYSSSQEEPQSTLLNSEINNIDANIETNTVLLGLLAEVTYADERVALNAVIAGLRADRVDLVAVAELVGIEIKGHSNILE